MTFGASKSGGMGRKAKILSDAQIKAMLAAVVGSTDRLMILFSVKAGMRACEIAAVTWPMVTDMQGQIGDVIALPNIASKGKNGGREIPMHPDIKAELAQHSAREGAVIRDRRGRRMSARAIVMRFQRLYRSLGFEGASSHSGRRTFITRLAHKIVAAGGSLRDVQQLAGHSSLSMTQVYIEGNSDAKRRAVGMI
jgi:integrase/recombinase XerD